MTVIRWTVTFDLHISGNEKQKSFVDTYQTNFGLCFPHANKSSSFHGICSSYWLGLDLQCSWTHWLRPRNPGPFPPRIWAHIRGLLVIDDISLWSPDNNTLIFLVFAVQRWEGGVKSCTGQRSEQSQLFTNIKVKFRPSFISIFTLGSLWNQLFVRLSRLETAVRLNKRVRLSCSSEQQVSYQWFVIFSLGSAVHS